MKAIKVLIALILLAVIGCAISGVVVDNFTSMNVETSLKSIPLPENTTVDASISRTGKLTSDYGPLEYYGAILLQSNQSLGGLRSYYSTKAPEDLDVKIVSLKNVKQSELKDLDPDLRFSHHDNSPDNYYILYSFAEGQDPFPKFDYRTYFN